MSKKNTKIKWTPRTWQLAILYPATLLFIVASLILVIINVQSTWVKVLSYISFVGAGITLALSIYTIVVYTPKIAKDLESRLRKNAFINSLFEQYDLRTIVFATVNLIVNIGYVVFNGVIGIVSKSLWYGSLAAYYLILTILRGVIVAYHGTNLLSKAKREYGYVDMSDKQAELRIYRLCGILLIILPIALSFVILDMVQSGSAFVKWGWTVYGFAAFAVYKIIASIVQIARARKKSEDYTVYGLRNVGFAAALVTVLAMQTALLHSFGNAGSINSAVANATTGAVVCLVTAVLGIQMIIKSTKTIKIQKGKEDEQNKR